RTGRILLSKNSTPFGSGSAARSIGAASRAAAQASGRETIRMGPTPAGPINGRVAWRPRQAGGRGEREGVHRKVYQFGGWGDSPCIGFVVSSRGWQGAREMPRR